MNLLNCLMVFGVYQKRLFSLLNFRRFQQMSQNLASSQQSHQQQQQLLQQPASLIKSLPDNSVNTGLHESVQKVKNGSPVRHHVGQWPETQGNSRFQSGGVIALEASSSNQNQMFPSCTRPSANPQQHQSFISAQMSELTIKKQQRHAQDHQFGGVAAQSSRTPVLPVTGSNSNLTSGILSSIPPHLNTKRSTLEEAGGTQLQEGSKYRLQQVSSLNRGSLAPGSAAQTSNMLASAFGDQTQGQYSRSFKGTGNQIAAVGSPSFLGKVHPTGNLLEGQQPPPFIGRMTRHTNLNQGKKQHYQHIEEKEMQQFALVPQHHSNFASHQRDHMETSPRQQLPGSGNRASEQAHKQAMMASNVAAANSAGRKQRVKSGRKRRFSSTSMQKNGSVTDQHNQTSSNNRQKNPLLQVHGTKEGICNEVMSQAAAQIMNYAGPSSKFVTGAAHSSVRELNFQPNVPPIERFNSRTNNKVMTSEPTNLVPHENEEADNLHELGSSSKSRQQIHNSAEMSYTNGSQYGTAPPHHSKKLSKSKISKSINRRNAGGQMQETSSGLNIDQQSQEHASQQSNKNFNSLRNSMTMNKKLSATANKKSKKLKKSESQARHQQQSKSELMTAQATRAMGVGETGSGVTAENVASDIGPSAYNGNPFNEVNNHGKSSSLHRPDPQKRGATRTPQGFQPSEKALGSQVQSRANSKHPDLIMHKGGSSNTTAAASIQINGSNLTELGKNAMHIKKLNFMNRGMQSNATQPIIAQQIQQTSNQHSRANGGLDHMHHMQQIAMQNQAKEQLPYPGSHVKQSQQANSGECQPFTSLSSQGGPKLEQILLKKQQQQPSTQGQATFSDYKSQFNMASSGASAQQSQTQTTSNAANKTYKLMKSAERGELNTHNLMLCNKHTADKNGNPGINKSPCTCVKAPAQHSGGFQGKASQNFQKTFRQGNFVYHGTRRSNDFSTIQAKQSNIVGQTNATSPFAAASSQLTSIQHPGPGGCPHPQQQQPIVPHLTNNNKKEDPNKFGSGSFNSQTMSQQQTQSSQQQQPSQPQNLNPLMNDLLQYLQQAYQNQQESIGATGQAAQPGSMQSSSEPAPVARRAPGPGAIAAAASATAAAQASALASAQASAQAAAAAAAATAQASLAATATANAAATSIAKTSTDAGNNGQQQLGDIFNNGQKSNKLVHFEKGDRIIYEPNEMHQLKYINEKGEVSPITGVQYILTQPNFSKGRPCHFFVVNKAEFEAATKGFKLKQQQEEQAKADELAKQKKAQAVANIRSHRASQKLRQQNTGTAKGNKKALERKQSAKGGSRNVEPPAKDNKTKAVEEEKKDGKERYNNSAYTYQKLRSLKWMGGVYKNPHDEPAPIWRPSAEEQELRHQLEQKREIKAKYNLLSLNKQETTELYKYILALGNNSDVVKRVLDARPSWAQIKSSQTLYNFKWTPSSRQIKFDFLGKHGQKNLVNHFENHALITTKDKIIESMSKLCEYMHQDVFNMIPITFILDLGTTLCQQEFDKFTYYFNIIEKSKESYIEAANDDEKQQEVMAQMNRNIQQHSSMNEKKRKYCTLSMRETLFDGHNMWLFKPADANRGRGVNLFNTIEQLKKLIVDHTSRAESKQFQTFATANNIAVQNQPNGMATEELPQSQSSQPSSAQAAQPGASASAQQAPQQPPIAIAQIKADVFVLQKYIEKPLLIQQRKFDIRLWVMITPEHKCYYFKEGYIRMSGQEYDMTQTDNLVVHLTNNAIQKHDLNYGQFEEGNILSFTQGTEFLKKNDGLDFDFHKLLREDMVPIIEATMMSVRQKINKNNRRFCMEIFGYDFMVDKNLRPWLIEVNTNPCLEESNQLLSQLIPRMLDDAFKLTLDIMFPPLSAAKIAEAMGEEEAGPQQRTAVFPVVDHPDTENLWGEQPFYILRVPGNVVVQGS